MKLLILTQKVDENDDVLGFMHGWLSEFAKHCEKITVIALEVGEYDLPKNVKVLSLGKEKRNSKLKYIFNFYKYIWQERKNYDNIFVHMNPEYIILGGVFWRMMGKKIGLWYTHKSVDLRLRIAEKLTHIIFSATPESFRLKSKKLNITGHGILLQKFLKPKDYRINRIFKIITVGRISPIKDYETLIDAIEILKNNNLNIQLDIIGGIGLSSQFNYLENLKQKVLDKSLEKNINFVGSVPNKDVANYLYQADLFINTSQTGSLDKAILEAMVSGLIVLSSNDSSRNIFEEYKDKLFFKSKDSEDLVKKISKINDLSYEERLKIGNKLRGTVIKNHNLENLIKKIIRIYQKI